ncbi:MAG: hypothetical protein ACTHPD_17535 [Rhizomicrobium sp.]
MKLTPEQIASYKLAHESSFNETITMEEAEEMARRILTFYSLVLKLKHKAAERDVATE